VKKNFGGKSNDEPSRRTGSKAFFTVQGKERQLATRALILSEQKKGQKGMPSSFQQPPYGETLRPEKKKKLLAKLKQQRRISGGGAKI